MPKRDSIGVFLEQAQLTQTQFNNGVIYLYSGTQPDFSTLPATGTLIGIVTLNGGVFVPGSPTNGLVFDNPTIVANHVELSMQSGALWQFTCIAAGTIGYARFRGNIADSNASSNSLKRMDMDVGTASDSTIVMAKTTYAVGEVGIFQSLTIKYGNYVTQPIPN